MTQVVAFTCQQCGVDFPAMGGGVCKSCKRMLCASHYGRPPSGEESADEDDGGASSGSSELDPDEFAA